MLIWLMLISARCPPGCAREWTAAVRPAVGRACTGVGGSPPHLIRRERERGGGGGREREGLGLGLEEQP